MIKLNQKGATLVAIVLVVIVVLILVTASYAILSGEDGVMENFLSNQVNETDESIDNSDYVIRTIEENVNLVVVNDI